MKFLRRQFLRLAMAAAVTARLASGALAEGM